MILFALMSAPGRTFERFVRISNYWISSAGKIGRICFTSRRFGCSKRSPCKQSGASQYRGHIDDKHLFS
jgi:hypothetical protein